MIGGISAPGHGKELVDGINAVDKHYMYQLMSKFQLPGSIKFGSQIKIHTGTEKKDVSLAREFKDHLEERHRQNSVINQGKPRERFMKREWTEIKYHILDNESVDLKDVKMYCNTNQFPTLPFCGPYSKPHGARGIGMHYHLRFDPKLGMGKCTIFRIPCSCVPCISILDKPWIYGIPSEKQERYKPDTKCTYWPVLGSFNNLNIIELSSKSTSFLCLFT